MNKKLLFLVSLLFATHTLGAGAVTIKKAAPVAVQETTAMDSVNGLVPTVINLVSGVSQINKQTQALTAECVPTSQEITDVNALIKEWAKVGSKSADEAFSALGVPNCATTGSSYESLMRAFGDDIEDGLLCYDSFSGSEHENMIWYKYPMAAMTYYCSDGGVDLCSEKNKVYVTNMYEVLGLIDFGDADYTANEAKVKAKLATKMEKCAPALLNAKKQALMSDFVVGTIGNLGQKTNTGSIMEMVSSVAGSTGNGAGGMLQSLGGIATQMLGGM